LNKPHPIDQRNLYTNLDHIPHSGVLDKVDKSLLSLSPKKELNIYKLSCSLFRSLCPVTNQPDWATILIQYKGRYIDESSILSYLLSYRFHKGFHEECTELIYTHIMLQCNPDELSIEAQFLRRGGIDINPFRTSLKEFSYFPYRDLRQ
jgi:7-cyano-7-deazaguanine reductase